MYVVEWALIELETGIASTDRLSTHLAHTGIPIVFVSEDTVKRQVRFFVGLVLYDVEGWISRSGVPEALDECVGCRFVSVCVVSWWQAVAAAGAHTTRCVTVSEYAAAWGCLGKPMTTQLATVVESSYLTYSAKLATYKAACESVRRVSVSDVVTGAATLPPRLVVQRTDEDVEGPVDPSALYPPHRNVETLAAQERAGSLFRAKLAVSRNLPTEATVRVRVPSYVLNGDGGSGSSELVETTVIIVGRLHCNRAMHGDDVAIEVHGRFFYCIGATVLVGALLWLSA